MKVTLYTDGSSRGNPGPGGWGVILTIPEEVIELGGREPLTTNNRMELMAAIEGLRHVNSYSLLVNGDSNPQLLTSNYQPVTSVEVFTDSQYVKKGMSEWIDGWIKKGWKGSTKKPVLNQDLWVKLKDEEDRLKGIGAHVTWKYVAGHSGDTMNDRADIIATSCADETMIELYRGPKKDYTP